MTELRKSTAGGQGTRLTPKSDKEQKTNSDHWQRRYMAGVQQIQAAVKAGKISREEAEKKLIEMRKTMAVDKDARLNPNSDKTQGTNIDPRQRRYMSAVRQIQAAIEAGKISKEEADKKLAAVRKAMAGDKDARPSPKSDKQQDRDIESKKRK